MSNRMEIGGLALAALLAGCSSGPTAARVIIDLEPGVQVDQLRLEAQVEKETRLSEKVPAAPGDDLRSGVDVVVLFDDALAPATVTFNVAGLQDNAQVARGSGEVVLQLHRTVTTHITLASSQHCEPGEHGCDDGCFPDDDAEHCGLACLPCGAPPAHGQTQCESGLCRTSCDPDYDPCETACVNLGFDARNCGACGNTCGVGELCQLGQCKPNPCGPGQHPCAEGCVSDQDVAHCGASCEPCPVPENGSATCDGIVCGVSCTTGFHACGDACVSDSSTASCGTRCTPCPAVPANAVPTCDGASCGFACSPGYHRCGQSCLSDASPLSCGTSCEPCPAPQHGTATCNGGYCGVSCDPGYIACGLECVSETADCLTWVNRMVSGPSARAMPAMTYDPVRKRTVLFGGWNGSASLDDTWEWDGTTWSNPSPARKPLARDGAILFHDGQRVVLFGGWDTNSNALDDTWFWDGTTWTERPLMITKPSARHGAAAALNTGAHAVVLFGGQGAGPSPGTAGPLLDDVWLWTGATASWAAAPGTSTGPPARLSPGMIFDPTVGNGAIVLFGGATAWTMDSVFSDLWLGTPSGWSQVSNIPVPPPRGAPGLVFDGAGGVLFGGATGPYTAAGDTWSWDGAAWTMLAPTESPPARGQMGMVFDSGRRRVVLFGGTDGYSYFDDTWELPR